MQVTFTSLFLTLLALMSAPTTYAQSSTSGERDSAATNTAENAEGSRGGDAANDDESDTDGATENDLPYIYGISAHASRDDSTALGFGLRFVGYLPAFELQVMDRTLDFLDLEARAYGFFIVFGGFGGIEVGARFRAQADDVGFAFRVNMFALGQMGLDDGFGILAGPHLTLRIDDVHLSLGLDLQHQLDFTWYGYEVHTKNTLEVMIYNETTVRTHVTVEFPIDPQDTMYIQFLPTFYEEGGKIRVTFLLSFGAWFR